MDTGRRRRDGTGVALITQSDVLLMDKVRAGVKRDCIRLDLEYKEKMYSCLLNRESES